MTLDPEAANNILHELGCEYDEIRWFNEDCECPECGNCDAKEIEEGVCRFLEEYTGDNVNDQQIEFESYLSGHQVTGTISDMIVDRLGYELV